MPDDIEARLAAKELQLAELSGLFLNATNRLALLCSSLGIHADEPAEKLAAAGRDLRKQHQALLEAADQLCDCAHPAGNGHYYILTPRLARLQQTLDRQRPVKPAPTPIPTSSNRATLS